MSRAVIDEIQSLSPKQLSANTRAGGKCMTTFTTDDELKRAVKVKMDMAMEEMFAGSDLLRQLQDNGCA